MFAAGFYFMVQSIKNVTKTVLMHQDNDVVSTQIVNPITEDK